MEQLFFFRDFMVYSIVKIGHNYEDYDPFLA